MGGGDASDTAILGRGLISDGGTYAVSHFGDSPLGLKCRLGCIHCKRDGSLDRDSAAGHPTGTSFACLCGAGQKSNQILRNPIQTKLPRKTEKSRKVGTIPHHH
jgi:hypothetical protein